MSYMKMMAMRNARDPYGGDENWMYNDYGNRNNDYRDQRTIGFESRQRFPRYEDGRFRPRNEMTGDVEPGRASRMNGRMYNMADYRGGSEYQVQGNFAMMGGGRDDMKLTKEEACEWVDSMENEDQEHPHGGVWSMEEAKELARLVHMTTDGPKFIDFYAIVNAMYSNYSKVAEEFGVEEPEFFAKMAKAWLEDKDAKKNKTALYYHCIVNK